MDDADIRSERRRLFYNKRLRDYMIGANSSFVLLAMMVFILSTKDIGMAPYGIIVGGLFVSYFLVSWSQRYIVYGYGTGMKVFGYFLHSIPLLAGVMFISIGATLKRQEEGTYKMGDAEPPFGKTTEPKAYYIAGSIFIAQFFFLIFTTVIVSKNSQNEEFDEWRPLGEPGLFQRLKDKFSSKNKGQSFTSSAHLDSDGVPNFQWICTKQGSDWLCKAKPN